MLAIVASIINLNHPAHYVRWGHWFQMSVSNLVVVVLMLVVFALAVALPAPGSRRKRSSS